MPLRETRFFAALRMTAFADPPRIVATRFLSRRLRVFGGVIYNGAIIVFLTDGQPFLFFSGCCF